MAVDLRDTGVGVHVVNPGVIDTELFHLPDNEEGFHSEVDALPVDEIVEPVLAMLDSGSIEGYVPAWFTDVVADKFKDPDAFIAGTKAYATPDGGQALARYSNRSGCSRVILAYIGWKLK